MDKEKKSSEFVLGNDYVGNVKSRRDTQDINLGFIPAVTMRLPERIQAALLLADLRNTTVKCEICRIGKSRRFISIKYSDDFDTIYKKALDRVHYGRQ